MSYSANTPPPTYAKQIASLQALYSGLTKHASTLLPMLILGKSYQAADVLSLIQSRIHATNAVPTARAAWRASVQTDQTERASTDPLIAGLKQHLLVAFANQLDVLADFGLAPRKTPVIAPATRVAAAQKAKATRAARHTMGSKQKAAIKGDASTVLVTAGAPTGGAAKGTASPSGAGPAAASASASPPKQS